MTTKWLSVHGGSVTMLPELKRLDEVAVGDVFYLLKEPSCVIERDQEAPGGYDFRGFGDEVYSRMKSVGNGFPDQLVVVVHNTRLHLTETVAGSGGG